MIYNNNDHTFECESCPEGQWSDRNTIMKQNRSQVCNSCPAGSYIQNGVSLSMFNDLPDNFFTLSFSRACTVNDAATGKPIKCSDDDGFRPVYMTGMVAGDNEAVGSVVTFVVDTTIHEDSRKAYNDASAAFEISTFFLTVAGNKTDRLIVYLNNQVISKATRCNLSIGEITTSTEVEIATPLSIGQSIFKFVYYK